MAMTPEDKQELQPAEYCRQALDAIEVAEERRKRRKRDTGPDVFGMDIKRDLLARAIDEHPLVDDFEGWLLDKVIRSPMPGPVRAMAEEILADYQNARSFHQFGTWLADGAPTPKVKDPARRRRHEA
jgi:hypothetical protein